MKMTIGSFAEADNMEEIFEILHFMVDGGILFYSFKLNRRTSHSAI